MFNQNFQGLQSKYLSRHNENCQMDTTLKVSQQTVILLLT